MAADEWLYAAQGARQADAAEQTRTWPHLCNTGTRQSPVDIVTRHAAPALALDGGKLEPHLVNSPLLLINTAHAFQIHETSRLTHQYLNATASVPTPSANPTPKGYTQLMGQRYDFLQLHWHTPSENTVDGEHSALEVHFVHQRAAEGLGPTEQLAVLAVLYDVGPACNAELDAFWADFPPSTGDKAYASSSGRFPIQETLEALVGDGFYHWEGSLTTPPCTEGVSWYLFKSRLPVCQRQVTRLETALAASQGLAFNNRVVQPLNQRVVAMTTAASSDECFPLAVLSSVLATVLFLILLTLAVPLFWRRSRRRKYLGH